MNEQTRVIDLDSRPANYFWRLRVEQHLLSRVKGAQRKEILKNLLEAGELGDVPEFLTRSALSDEERRALARIHPMLMGGEYLPDMEEQEIEIARICLRSVTSDVTSVYARLVPGGIAYRVVDEYEGSTLEGPSECTSPSPLSLGELTSFFLGAWWLMETLEVNFEDDLESMLRFFRGESAFYPQFDELLRQMVAERFGQDDGGPDGGGDGQEAVSPADLAYLQTPAMQELRYWNPDLSDEELLYLARVS